MFNSPFNHLVLDDFLTKNELKKVNSLYNKLELSLKQSDLFIFYQSKELEHENLLTNFKEKIIKIFKNLIDFKEYELNIFASCYEEDNYLLCHDDCTEHRKYAFTYYLDDCDSGSLLLYENDCKTLSKKVEIKKNRLVVFEVSPISFHEVDICYDRRKALTGWLQLPNVSPKPFEFNLKYFLPENIQEIDFGLDYTEDEVICSKIDVYPGNITKINKIGPFIYRRCSLVELDQFIVPIIKDYTLIHAQYLKFDISDYILINDIINMDIEDIYDVFYFECKNKIEDFIMYINEDGDTVFSITAENQAFYAGPRNNTNLFIQRVTDHVKLRHFIYKKNK